MGKGGLNDKPKKIVIIGDKGVGKSAIIKMFTEKQLSEEYEETIMGEVFPFYSQWGEKQFNFIIYETSSEEEFKKLSHCVWKDSSWIILVYEVTNKKTYENIDSWIEELKTYAEDAKIILVGNKIYLKDKRAITKLWNVLHH